MARKDRNDSQIFMHLISKQYEKQWGYYTTNSEIQKVFSTASKNGKGNIGYIDQIYVNEDLKLLILVEDKPLISKHISEDGISNPENYAVDGIIWYMSRFINTNDITIKEYFANWNILGIAISGDLNNEYNHRISTFAIISDRKNDKIIKRIQEIKNIKTILNEQDYINLFKNLDEETTIKHISESSKKINNLLRSVDSQKRPILLSALMISLFEIKNGGNSFINEFNGNTAIEIVNKLDSRVDTVLESENIPEDKRNILKSELNFIKFDKDLNNDEFKILKKILNELRTLIIPLFSKKSNYDIIGKFYEEFLRFAGVSNVKKGIVLTPHHITTLFTELIDIKSDDVILDPCCGTGAFLIAAMNKLIELKKEEQDNITEKIFLDIKKMKEVNILNIIKIISQENKLDEFEKNEIIEAISNVKVRNEENLINEIKSIREKQFSKILIDLKSKQLIGFEKNSTMYSLAISNMLFRGDGKSQIFNNDYFDSIVKYKLENIVKKSSNEIKAIKESTILGKLESDGIKPTIGFINPPYGGKDNKENPTKKEIQFLIRLLDHVSKYCIIIAPLSTYFKEETIRTKILEKHTLKYVINMPKDLFMPNAATNTAIAVFEVNKPHDNKEVTMYDLKDDGFVLSKSKGRTNLYNKWDKIKKDLLYKLNFPDEYIDNISLLKAKIKVKDEWLIQAHSITDYSNLSEEKFESAIKEHLAYQVKKEMNLLEENIDEIDFLDLISDFYNKTIKCTNCEEYFKEDFKYCPYCGYKKGDEKLNA